MLYGIKWEVFKYKGNMNLLEIINEKRENNLSYEFHDNLTATYNELEN